jgi:hypothetical protein
MITSSDVNKMCALLEPHDIGVALARRLQELYRCKLSNLDFKLKMMKGEEDGEITDKKLEQVVQLEKQWHAANEVYMWVTNLLEQKEAPNV